MSGLTGGSALLSFTIEAEDLKKIIRERGLRQTERFHFTGRLSTPKYHLEGALFFEGKEANGIGDLYLKVSPDYRTVYCEYFRA
jgi:hypothetical protein